MMDGYPNLYHKPKVIIIGGGPAGSAAAIWCAKFGFHAVIIESAKFPRNRPGETLHPGVDTLFDQLGIKEDIEAAKFMRHTGTGIRWNSGNDDYNNYGNDDNRKLITFGEDEKGPWLGYQASRATLDSILLQRAQRCGVRILQPCQALDVIFDGNRRVIGVKTSCGNFTADFVIDASGGIHWLARRLKLTIKKYSPTLFAYYGYAKGECPSRDKAPAIVVTPEGWIWTAKIREHLYQWTRLYFDTNDDNNKMIPHGWLPDEFKALKSIQSMHGADVTWRRVVQPAGSGYFIVGDAATVLDPASSHGVLKGIMSGIQAAHAIIRITKDHFPSEIACNNYNKWIKKWFLYDIDKLKRFYSKHPSPPNWLWDI
jgi:flavin-dependent dehydrogenase